MNKDKRAEAVERLMDKIIAGERLSEDEVFETLCIARDQSILSIAKNTLQNNFEDMSSVEIVNVYDDKGSTEKNVSRRDILRMYNVLQNAVERHAAVNGPKQDNPLEALAAVWVDAVKRVPK